MAYDKVVDSAVLNAGLKQIADAIREKGGTSDNLAFPAAMAEAIAAIEAGGGAIFGSKFITGSFTLAAETTTAYAFATEEDLEKLLDTGESLTSAYKQLACVVYRQPSTEAFSGSNYKKTLVGSMCVPTYVAPSGGAGGASCGIAYDNYGSPGAVSGGTPQISYNSVSLGFNNNAKGSPDFEYRWVMWRAIK